MSSQQTTLQHLRVNMILIALHTTVSPAAHTTRVSPHPPLNTGNKHKAQKSDFPTQAQDTILFINLSKMALRHSFYLSISSMLMGVTYQLKYLSQLHPEWPRSSPLYPTDTSRGFLVVNTTKNRAYHTNSFIDFFHKSVQNFTLLNNMKMPVGQPWPSTQWVLEVPFLEWSWPECKSDHTKPHPLPWLRMPYVWTAWIDK